MSDIFDKRRNRTAPEFANINLLGKCNAKCTFCLGKELEDYYDGQDQLHTHFSVWKNWDRFLDHVWFRDVEKVYITGQNTDSLQYEYLSELIDELHDKYQLKVGLRTNGLLWREQINDINKCELSTGYSIHTLKVDVNKKIMGWPFVLSWDDILDRTERPRVAMVITRDNVDEFLDVVDLVKRHPHVRYMQARRVSTDFRKDELRPDIEVYEKLYERVAKEYEQVGEVHAAPIFNIDGVKVTFWRTVQTSIGSINYFTDGTISDEYFIVEGYMKHHKKHLQVEK